MPTTMQSALGQQVVVSTISESMFGSASRMQLTVSFPGCGACSDEVSTYLVCELAFFGDDACSAGYPTDAPAGGRDVNITDSPASTPTAEPYYNETESPVITPTSPPIGEPTDAPYYMEPTPAPANDTCTELETAYLACFASEMTLDDVSSCVECFSDAFPEEPETCSDLEDAVCDAPVRCGCSTCADDITAWYVKRSHAEENIPGPTHAAATG